MVVDARTFAIQWISPACGPVRTRRGKRVEITYSPLFADTGVQASKDTQEVVNVVHNAGLARLVVRLKPLIIVKR